MDTFEEIWELSPKKVGKKQTKEYFNKQNYSDEDIELIKKYFNHCKAQYNCSKRYGLRIFPHMQDPIRVLRNERFLDDMLSWPTCSVESGGLSKLKEKKDDFSWVNKLKEKE